MSNPFPPQLALYTPFSAAAPPEGRHEVPSASMVWYVNAWLAQDPSSQFVRVEAWTPHVNDTPSAPFVKRWADAAHRFQNVSHPALLKTLECCVESATAWLVMEFAPVQSLRRRVETSGPRSEAEVRGWLPDLLDVMEAVNHPQSGLRGYDALSPDTICLSEASSLKLEACGPLRFGHAPGSISPPYRAPEALGMQARQPASDFYSLGASLYFAVTGQDPPDSMQRIVGGVDMPDVRDLNPVSAGLAELVKRLTAVRPGQRPADFAAVRTACR